MKFQNIFFLLILIFAGILLFTNPDDQTHKLFIKDKFTNILNRKIDEELGKVEDPNIKMLGRLGKNFFPVFSDKMIDQIINERVKRKNYYLFSTTRILYKEQWHTVGIGVLDQMCLFPKVEEELQKLDFKSEALKYLNK